MACGVQVLSTENYQPPYNLVNLRSLSLYRSYKQKSQLWEKFDEGNDGWMKLRHHTSGLVLTSSNDGKNLTTQINANPCNGRKPCFRYVHMQSTKGFSVF